MRLREVIENRSHQMKRVDELYSSARRILDDYAQTVCNAFLIEMKSLEAMGWSVHFYSIDKNGNRTHVEHGFVVKSICDNFGGIFVEANRSRSNGRIVVEFHSLDDFISWFMAGCPLV